MGAKDQATLAEQTSDPDELRAMAGSRFTAVRAAVARNAATPDDVLQLLVEDRHHLPRFAVAENLKPSALEVALRAPDSSVRVILAQRQDLPFPVVRALLGDPEREVRISLGWSTRDEGILRSLALDTDSRVRSVIPFNTATPDDLIGTLSRDPDRNVRCCVVTSYRASEDQLQALLRDKSSLVRAWVLQYYSRRADILEALEADPSSGIAHDIADLRAGRVQHGVSDLVVREAQERHLHRSIARLT